MTVVKKKWKKNLTTFLVLVVTFGAFSYLGFGNKVEGAPMHIVSKVVTTMSNDNTSEFYVEFSDNSRAYFKDNTLVKPYDENVTRIAGDYYLKKDGTVWRYTTGSQFTATKFKDLLMYQYNPSGGAGAGYSYIGLTVDNRVMGWGIGTSGALGIGGKVDRTTPAEVVDPDTGDILTDVKKIFTYTKGGTTRSYGGVVLVKDAQAYALGTVLGTNSNTGSPGKITKLPAYNSANNFDMGFINNASDSLERSVYNGAKNPAYNQFITDRVYFNIEGKTYTTINPDVVDSYNNDTSTASTIYEIPYDWSNTSRMAYYGSWSDSSPPYNMSNTLQAYHTVNAGNFSVWGFTSWGDWTYSYKNPSYGFNTNKINVTSNVKKVAFSNMLGLFYILKNDGKVFIYGRNAGSNGGIANDVSTTPMRVSGPNDELTDIIDIAVVRSNNDSSDAVSAVPGSAVAVRSTGDIVIWKNTFKVLSVPSEKIVGLISPKAGTSDNVVLAITDVGKLYNVNANKGTLTNIAGIANVFPAGYVPPSVLPQPVLTESSSANEFYNKSVTIDYGTSQDIFTKQYSYDGVNWLEYTGPILLNEAKAYKVYARSLDSKGKSGDVASINVTNNPILLNPSQPVITDDGIGKITVNYGTEDVRVKKMYNVDNSGWIEYTGIVSINNPGNHKFIAELRNDKGIVLSSTTKMVKGTPAPPDKPVLSQVGLTSDYMLQIDLSYKADQGAATYSINSGKDWTSYDASSKILVKNKSAVVKAKVTNALGVETIADDLTTSPVKPTVTSSKDNIIVDIHSTASNVKTVYELDGSGSFKDYVGPITGVADGNHNIVIKVVDKTTDEELYVGDSQTINVDSGLTPDPGNGGGNTPDPGTNPPVVDPGNPSPNLPGDIGTPVGSHQVDFTVKAGGLASEFQGVDLSTIVIDSTKDYQSINSVSKALVEDSRGSGEGWQYSLKITDFNTDPLNDNSTKTQDLIVQIPANSLKVNVLNNKKIEGQNSTALSKVGSHIFGHDIAEVLAAATRFEGMGYYDIPLEFALSIPNKVKVVSSGIGSKYVPGMQTGLMTGTYRSTFTFTLTSGI